MRCRVDAEIGPLLVLTYVLRDISSYCTLGARGAKATRSSSPLAVLLYLTSRGVLASLVNSHSLKFD